MNLTPERMPEMRVPREGYVPTNLFGVSPKNQMKILQALLTLTSAHITTFEVVFLFRMNVIWKLNKCLKNKKSREHISIE